MIYISGPYSFEMNNSILEQGGEGEGEIIVSYLETTEGCDDPDYRRLEVSLRNNVFKQAPETEDAEIFFYFEFSGTPDWTIENNIFEKLNGETLLAS
jgi:hypothetical protein